MPKPTIKTLLDVFDEHGVDARREYALRAPIRLYKKGTDEQTGEISADDVARLQDAKSNVKAVLLLETLMKKIYGPIQKTPTGAEREGVSQEA